MHYPTLPSWTASRSIRRHHSESITSTYPKKLPQRRVIRFAGFPFDVFLNFHITMLKLQNPKGKAKSEPPTRSFVNQNRRTANMRPSPSSESPMLGSLWAGVQTVCVPRHKPYKGFWSIQVVPIFCPKRQYSSRLVPLIGQCSGGSSYQDSALVQGAEQVRKIWLKQYRQHLWIYAQKMSALKLWECTASK